MINSPLKAAIEKSRGKVVQPDNMALFLRQIAHEIFKEHLTTIAAEVKQEVAAIKEQVLAESRSAIVKALEVNWEKLRGPRGKPGVGLEPDIDLEKLAQMAAVLVPVPKVEIDEEKIVEKVLGKIPAPAVPEGDLEEEKIETPPVDMQPQAIVDAIHSLDKPIKLSAIDGLEQWLKNVQKSMRDSGSGKMIHGGGMTLTAGSNITLTRQSDGTWSIASTGGGGFSALTATETPNSSLKVFTFAAASAQPSYLVVDNVWMKATSKAGTVNWTWSAGLKQATLAVPANDDIFGIV